MKKIFLCYAAISAVFIEAGVSQELVVPGRTVFDSKGAFVGYVSGVDGHRYVVQRKNGDTWIAFFFTADGFERQSEPNIYFATEDCSGQGLIRADSSTMSTFVEATIGSSSRYVTDGRLYYKSGSEFVGLLRSSRSDSAESSCIAPPAGYGAMLVAPFRVTKISGLVGPFTTK